MRTSQQRHAGGVAAVAGGAGVTAAANNAPLTASSRHLACHSDAANESYLIAFYGDLRLGAGLDSQGNQPSTAPPSFYSGTIAPARPRPVEGAATAPLAVNACDLTPLPPHRPRGVGAPTLPPCWRTPHAVLAPAKRRVSEHPLLCSAARWPDPGGGDGGSGSSGGEVVLGGADHALYVVDARTAALKRTLYSQRCGHKEWVTAAAWLLGGRVVSGGMDGALWLWAAAGSAGAMAAAHSGPVSQVRAVPGSSAVLSAGYDKTLALWDASGQRAMRRLATFAGPGAAVLEAEVCAGAAGVWASAGDRAGAVAVWDLAGGCRRAPSWACVRGHQGHVTCLAWPGGEGAGGDAFGGGGACSSRLVLSGGQDGWVRAWDVRAPGGRSVAERRAHAGAKGRGAVTAVLAGGAATAGAVATAGADGRLCTLEPRASLAPRAAPLALPDFPYSAAAAGGLAFCGCGDGSVVVADLVDGRELYRLRAGTAAVRALEVDAGCLVAAGDAGEVVSFAFTAAGK